MARDYYDVLGVSRDAGPDELQQAFRRLARANHPDVNKDPGAEERFKEINEAYSALSDPELRKRYDRFGEDFRRVPEDWEQRVGAGAGGFGGRAGRGPRTTWTAEGADVGGGFGGAGLRGHRHRGPPGRHVRRPRPRPRAARTAGADQEAELPLTVEEAYRGGRKEITLNGPDGPRSYTVTIPPGVNDGRRIRLAGEGGRGLGDGPAGDLYLVVRLLPHPLFRVHGRNIHVDLKLAPWEAALGATVPVATPGGETKVTVPPGSSSGRRLRLRGQGMPDPAGHPGDLFAEIKIMVPPRLSDRERELFSELATSSTFDPRRATTDDGGGRR